MASNYFVRQPLTMLSEQSVRTIHDSAVSLLRRVGIRIALGCVSLSKRFGTFLSKPDTEFPDSDLPRCKNSVILM